MPTVSQQPPENENHPQGPGGRPDSQGQQGPQGQPFGEQPTQAMPTQGYGEQPTQAIPPHTAGSPQDAAHEAGTPGHTGTQPPGSQQPGVPGHPGQQQYGQGQHSQGQFGQDQQQYGQGQFGQQQFAQHGAPGYGAPQQPGGPGYPGGPQGPGGPGYGPGGPAGPGGGQQPQKGFFAKFWWAIVLLGVLFAAMIALVIVLFTMGNGDDDDTETESTSEDEAVTEDEDDEEPADQEEDEDPEEDEDAVIEDEDDDDDADPDDTFPTGGEAFSDGGAMIVGEDIEPGTYRQDVGTEDEDWGCFYSVWEDEDEDDLITSNANGTGGIVVLEDGMLMNSMDCGDWLPVEETYPDSPETVAENGQMYVIGEHIEAGTYQLNWDVDSNASSCSYYVYSDLTEWDWEDFNAWFDDEDEWEEEEVEMHLGTGSQVFFHNNGCGTWELVD